MKIVACLGVKDEIELIAAAVDHLRRIGIAHILASDAGSTDGTAEVLARLSRDGTLDHLRFDDRALDAAGEEALTRDIFDRARAMNADWLLFVDADEFPLPRDGRLDNIRALHRAEAVIVPRYNVVVRPGGPAIPLPNPYAAPDDILVFTPAEERRAAAARVRADPEAAWIMTVQAPKVMVRPDRVQTTLAGHHGVATGDGLKRQHAAGLFIAHLPFTTEARFSRKLANIRAAVEASGDAWAAESAWHWRRWIANVDERGGVAGEMARNLVDDTTLAELRRTRLVRSARDIWGS